MQIFDEVKTLIHDIYSKEEKIVTSRVVVMLWLFWNNKNNWIWNNEKSDETQLGTQAFHSWKD